LKRNYIKPELQTIKLDREISLSMMTDENNPPDPPVGAPPAPAQSEFQKSNFKENPFNEKK